MMREYVVTVEGQVYTVVVSDEKEALLAAKAAGTASVTLWDREREEGLFLTNYAVETLEDIDQEYLEQVVRRHLGLPWEILRTQRLVIREFQPGDEAKVPREPEDEEADEVFRKPELLREYIRCQYGFYGYGIWALIEKDTGRLIGKAGVFNLEWDGEKGQGLELGYHIFTPYRRKGYGEEACRGILEWCRGMKVYAKTDASNQASVNLLNKLGFNLTDQKCSESGQWHCLYVWNC